MTIALIVFVKSTSVCQNVLVSNAGYVREPSIMMNLNDPNILVAGTVFDGYFISNDGGLTWTTQTLTSPYGVAGDPVIDFDTLGNFYYTHLSNTPGGNIFDRIVCQKSSDNGNTWSGGTYTGLNGTKTQDKPWTVIDRTNNNIYMTWAEFDDHLSTNSLDSSRILFSKSTDQGDTWSTPIKINTLSGDCIFDDSTVFGAVPAVGPNGEIYVSWASPNGIVFNRSLDQGDTWLGAEIQISSLPGGWNFNLPGIERTNGFPITKCDLSGGVNHGTIYVNWSDQRNGTTNTDIWLSKSTDGGNTWSLPTRVNDDNSNRHQFFTWMDIDQTNGNLFFVFYDRRAYSDNKTDVFMAVSSDGGNTFVNVKVSETPFTPQVGMFISIGDYINIVAHNNIVRPIWTRYDAGTLSIWTNVSDLNTLLNIPENNNLEVDEVKLYPNPTNDITYVSFKLRESSSVTLKLVDMNGSLIEGLINDVKMESGKHLVSIDTKKLILTSGIYQCILSVGGKSKVIKKIMVQ